MAGYLEVDPAIIENNFLISCKPSSATTDSFDFLRSGNISLGDAAPWKLATPLPGCCLKTTDCTKNKVFINVCQLDDIPQPKEITEEELINLWQSEEASDFRIPLSIQEPHDELDKSGKPTIVYDVAINTDFFKLIQTKMVFQTFVVQVILEGIENKYNIALDKEGYIILKNRKSIGPLKPHRIKLREAHLSPPKPLIEVLSNDDTSKGVNKREKGGQKGTEHNENLLFRLFLNYKEHLLVGEFYLPKIIDTKDINLCAGEDFLLLECHRSKSFSDFFIPFKIDCGLVKASFDGNSKILSVTMPINFSK